MRTYLVKRTLFMIPVLVAVTLLVFLMLRLAPGDPVYLLAGPRPTPELIEKVRTEYGLDLPLYQQYLRFLSNLLHGNLGRSMMRHQPVTDLLRQALPITIELGVAAVFISTLIGIPLGITSASKAGTWVDQSVMVFAVIGISMPAFWSGIMLMYVFGVHLHLLPTSGHGSVAHLIMPALALGADQAALLSRVTRSSMLEVVTQDYIRTARAKGLSERVVIYRHALKNAILPVVTILGLRVGYMLAGSVVLEMVFARPGMGRLLVYGILQRDYPVVQAMLLILAFAVMAANFLVDVVYALLDPQIQFD